MLQPKYFKYSKGKLLTPVFFPDATRGFVKAIDVSDIKETKTPGILVNTYHLYKELGIDTVKKLGGIRKFMNWPGAVISDSGGFQVMSLVKSGSGKGSVTDKGVTFNSQDGKKILLTPEKSMQIQMNLNTDMVVVLDDFTHPNSTYEQAKESVERSIHWAERSKNEFEQISKQRKLSKEKRPYILGVVQGGKYQDLRKHCIEKLAEIGFDGLGYGGWPLTAEGKFDIDSAKTIAKFSPSEYFLYGLGIGKPDEIVQCVDLGFTIFDCVLPTRDARHGRLYVFNANSIKEIDINKKDFYSFFVPEKQKYYRDSSAVSKACDCLLCKNYSRAYLAHLFRMKEPTALRLATIHNLRLYSILMEKLQLRR